MCSVLIFILRNRRSVYFYYIYNVTLYLIFQTCFFKFLHRIIRRLITISAMGIRVIREFSLYCFEDTWRWRQRIIPKHRCLSTILHGVKSHDRTLFIITAVRNSTVLEAYIFHNYNLTFYFCYICILNFYFQFYKLVNFVNMILDGLNTVFWFVTWLPFRAYSEPTPGLGRDVGKWMPCGAGGCPPEQASLTGCSTRKWDRRLIAEAV
jgi:hypothetical protein